MSIASNKDYLGSRLVGTSEIIQTLLNFVWNNWDHPVEVQRQYFLCAVLFKDKVTLVRCFLITL